VQVADARLPEALRRLQTDYINLKWMHFWDPHSPIEEGPAGRWTTL